MTNHDRTSPGEKLEQLDETRALSARCLNPTLFAPLHVYPHQPWSLQLCGPLTGHNCLTGAHYWQIRDRSTDHPAEQFGRFLLFPNPFPAETGARALTTLITGHYSYSIELVSERQSTADLIVRWTDVAADDAIQLETSLMQSSEVMWA